MQLVITEKPSVGLAIAAVLGAKERKEGYLQGNGYIVSWCVGHLVELAQAEAYDEKYGKWSFDDLPIVPGEWKYTVAKDKGKQLGILRALMRRADVGGLICATDAGREGELIFRMVYRQCGCTKPFMRLWISSMEERAISKGFRDLKPSADYDRLYEAALCRAQADWIVGINATRLFSVLYHQTLNVGRVMTPTLAMIVQRESQIDAFKPQSFYTVQLDCGSFTANSERLSNAAANALCAACHEKSASVRRVERQDKSEKPPKLYDLTALQRDANRLLGFTAQQTLDYAQALYEKRLLTYPRTDSRYLTEDMAYSLPQLVYAAAGALPYGTQLADMPVNTAQVIDNKKVSDHHAIICTNEIGKADLLSLPAGERGLLYAVLSRMLCAVGKPYRYVETSVTLFCADTPFSAKGRSVTDNGWKQAELMYRAYIQDKEAEEKETALPDLQEGAVISHTSTSIKEGKTTPPKHFTEDTILSAMESAGSADMPEDAERKGLGTPATRAGILEKLVHVGYVERKGDKKIKYLLPTHKAISLITVLPEVIQSPQLTAEWEERLKRIERGALTGAEFMTGILELTEKLVKTYEVISGAEVLFPKKSKGDIMGKCPRCGTDVTESKKGFFCSNRECRFALWKDNKFFTAKKKTLTKEIAMRLLKDGKAHISGLYSEKTGKTYDATVILDDTGGKYVNFMLEFPARR